MKVSCVHKNELHWWEDRKNRKVPQHQFLLLHPLDFFVDVDDFGRRRRRSLRRRRRQTFFQNGTRRKNRVVELLTQVAGIRPSWNKNTSTLIISAYQAWERLIYGLGHTARNLAGAYQKYHPSWFQVLNLMRRCQQTCHVENTSSIPLETVPFLNCS